MTHAIRWVRTRVLPLPAPARTSTGPSGAVTASRCASFRGLRIGDRSIVKQQQWTAEASLLGASLGVYLEGSDCTCQREQPVGLVAPGEATRRRLEPSGRTTPARTPGRGASG